MNEIPYPKNLTSEQSEALEAAALLVIRAREEAAATVERARIDPFPDDGPFGSPCRGTLPPPPQNRGCGCRNYRGDGGPCQNANAQGLPCRHKPSQHLFS